MATLTYAASLLAASVHQHRRGHIFGPVILLIIIVVVVILVVQRRRNRKPIAEGSPTALNHQVSASDPRDSEDSGGGAATVTLTAVALDMAPPAGRYNLIDLARSEWTKLRTVRSTMWTLVIIVVLGLGISAIATAETRANWSTMSPQSIATFDPVSLSLVGLFIAQFAMGVLGVLVITSEYSTGTVRAVFAAAPQRMRVLLAKILVFGVLAVIVAEIVSFASFFLGQALLSSPAIHDTLASPGALRAVAGCGLFIAALGLLALGLGTIIRHSAGAISCFVGILLILPLLVQALPSSVTLDVRKFLPDRIGVTMITTNGGSGVGAFSPWVGLLILVCYAVAANVIGAVMLSRRDA
jgi:ABC-type transport system involved in multi-copper enzyme maturation permease subunit